MTVTDPAAEPAPGPEPTGAPASDTPSAGAQSAGAQPAGAWYPDPLGTYYARWWDGAAWTTAVHDGQEVLIDTGQESAAPATAGDAGAGAEETPDEPTAAPTLTSDETADRDELPVVPDPTTGKVAERTSFFDEEPPPKRKKGAPPPTTRPSRSSAVRVTVAVIGVAAVIVAALGFGWSQRSTAAQWRDRADELEAQLDTSLASNDDFEEALSEAASARARLTDSQEAFAELEEEVRAVTREIYDCANALTTMAVAGQDIDALIDRAQDACNTAVARAEGLAAFLDELQV